VGGTRLLGRGLPYDSSAVRVHNREQTLYCRIPDVGGLIMGDTGLQRTFQLDIFLNSVQHAVGAYDRTLPMRLRPPYE
jgi:hypothetical protein